MFTILNKAAGPQKGPSGINLDKPEASKLPENLIDFFINTTIAIHKTTTETRLFRAKQTLRDLMSDLIPIASYTVGEGCIQIFIRSSKSTRWYIRTTKEKNSTSRYGHTAPSPCVGNAGDYQ